MRSIVRETTEVGCTGPRASLAVVAETANRSKEACISRLTWHGRQQRMWLSLVPVKSLLHTVRLIAILALRPRREHQNFSLAKPHCAPSPHIHAGAQHIVVASNTCRGERGAIPTSSSINTPEAA